MQFFFAWFAALGFGLETVIGKVTSKYSISDPWVFNFAYPFVIMLAIIPISIFNHAIIPAHWSNLILAGFFQALAFIFFVLSLFKLDVSVFAPLFNFRSIFSVILGILFLKEGIGSHEYLLVALVFFAGMFVTIDEKFSLRSFFTFPVFLMILDTFFWSLNSFFINKASSQESYWTISLWVALICQFFLLFTFPLFYKKIAKTKNKNYIGIIAMAFAGVLGTLASIKAFSTNISISTIIISLPVSMILVPVLSIFIPKLLEKHTLKVYAVRFVSAAIMVAAAIKLSS